MATPNYPQPAARIGIFFLCLSLGQLSALTAERPNVVFMLADDLGWSDTTPYGSTFYETPNIERLARRGMLFTNAYSASPLCSPTRASILTGQYPGRLRFTTPAGHLPQEILDPQVPDKASPDHHVTIPGTRTRLPNDYVTVAEVLKQAGYRTAFLGKWHLGRAPYLPENQGFDLVVGGREHPGPPGGYFAPWPIDTIPESPQGSHIDDVITAEAIEFLEANRDQPFFLNLWFYSVHAPFEAKQHLVEKYRAKAKAKADPDNLQTNPVMGGMIETLDDNVGRVLDTLRRLGLVENTVIIFTSDNGGNEYNFVEGVEATNNAPLRNGKGNIYDGGHRVPLIASWPGKISEGANSDAIVTSVDYFPTILEVIGQPQPQGQTCDGMSLWPVLQGKRPDPSRPIFCHFPHMPPATGNLPATSVRRGNWKLLRFHGDGPGQTDRLELYDLTDDIGETRNLAKSRPDLAAEFSALVEAHLANTAALVPKKNPNYRPSILGWTGNKHAKLTRAGGALRVESTGKDPWLQTRFFPQTRGRITVELRMKSNASGGGAVYVATQDNPSYARQRIAPLQARHDGRWHNYRVDITLDSRLRSLRIDPAQGPGTIEISSLRIIQWTAPGTGRVSRHWSF